MSQVKVYTGEETLAKWNQICGGFTSNTAAFAVIVEVYHAQMVVQMFRIDSRKLAEVTRIFHKETDSSPTKQALRESICYDWPEGEEHQQWITEASPQEIADWLASFHQAE